MKFEKCLAFLIVAYLGLNSLVSIYIELFKCGHVTITSVIICVRRHIHVGHRLSLTDIKFKCTTSLCEIKELSLQCNTITHGFVIIIILTFEF